MSQEQESSVEEILESIKKVMARDESAGASFKRSNAKNSESETDSEDTASDEAETTEDETVLDLGEMVYLEEDVVEDDMEQASSEDNAPLTNSKSRESIVENLDALALLAQPGAQPQIVRSGETSLEGLVREMLRPMLSEWLDNNLPDMVEKLVQDEIARIARKGK